MRVDAVPPSAGGGAQSNQTLGLYATSNTTGASSSSTFDARSVTFQGAGIASVGFSNGSVVVSVPSGGGVGDGVNIVAAGTQTAATTGTVMFSNSNNVSFGMSNSSIVTASASFAQSNQQMTFSATGNTTQSSTGTMNASSIILRGSNLVSVGISNGSLIFDATQTNPVVSNAIQLVGSATGSGTNTSRFAADDHVHAGVFSVGVSTGGNTVGDTRVDVGRFVLQGGNSVTLSQITAANALNTIVISGPNALTSQSNQAFSAQGGSSAFQTLSFNNANGITFSNNAGAVEASYTRPVVSNAIQSVGSATNSGTNTSRFAADDHVHAGVFSVGVSTGGNTVGDTRVDVGRFVLQGGNNVTLSQITAANALNTIIISGANAGGAQTGISGIQVSDTTYTSGTVTFQNANGISFGASGVNGVSASYTRPVVSNAIQSVGSATGSGTNTSRFAADDHVHAGVFSMGVSGGNTAGDTRVDVGRFVLAGGANITLSQATAAGALNTISIVGGAGGAATLTAFATGNTTQSSTGTIPLSSLIVRGSNIVSAGISNGSIIVDATQSNQAFSAAGGSSAFQTLSFNDSPYASFTNTNGSIAVTELRGSFFATSNTTQSSSGTQNLDAITFAGAGIASVGISNGSVVVSVPSGGGAGDGGVFAGVSNLGNTAGSTGTVSTGNFVLVGSNGISLSQSTGAAGSAATVTIYGPSPLRSAQWPEHAQNTNAASGITNSLSYCQPIVAHEAISGSYARFLLTMGTSSTSFATTANTTFSCSQFTTWNCVLYTRNAQTLSSVSSGSAGMTQQWSLGANANGSQYTITYALSYPVTGGTSSYSTSVAVSNASFQMSSNSLTLFTGGKYFDIPMNINMTPGQYWMMWGMSSNSSTQGTAAMTGLRLVHSVALMTEFAQALGFMGVQSASSNALKPGLGSFSTAGGGTLATINLSAISSNASNSNFIFQIKLDSH